MQTYLSKAIAWYRTPHGTKLFRYTMVSAISTVISSAAIIVFKGLLHWSELSSTVVGNAVAIFPSYWLNRRWAWGKSGRSHLIKEVAPFWAMAASGIAFSAVGAELAHHLNQAEHFSHLVQTLVTEIANLVSFGIFWVLKLVVNNKLFHVGSPSGSEPDVPVGTAV